MKNILEVEMKKLLEEIKFDADFIKGHTLQPQWYKIFKVFLLLALIVGFVLIFGGLKTLIFFGVFFGLGLVLHMIYRINTKKFTQSWLDFKVEEVGGQLEYQRIGPYYYLIIGANGIIAFVLSRVLVS
jgi:hypothetical protein